MLKVNEIFYSIQGESSMAGLPCIFIRLTYCNLRCSYCDTEYAFYEGTDYTIEEILAEIKKYNCNLVEVTGGEPLVQKEALSLMKILCDLSYQVMIETSGSLPIKEIDQRVKVIMDLKCPSSKMSHKNLYENISYLKRNDEVKFVIGNREDYNWSKNVIDQYQLAEKCAVLFSNIFSELEPARLVEWILKDNLKVRFQIQMHKYIWSPTQRGV
ncbi:MAG: 7-carboxy-7-deazaguanine synthase [Ignavibacteria bacterium GWA2_36_19]|nr:MAG: 7-carboxy-7-deazaguanine synthase [Ignavibacteria bacterium GWA2_36_19]